MTGLEPARRGHQILSLARLPIPPHPQVGLVYHIFTGMSIEKYLTWKRCSNFCYTDIAMKFILCYNKSLDTFAYNYIA